MNLETCLKKAGASVCSQAEALGILEFVREEVHKGVKFPFDILLTKKAFVSALATADQDKVTELAAGISSIHGYKTSSKKLLTQIRIIRRVGNPSDSKGVNLLMREGFDGVERPAPNVENLYRILKHDKRIRKKIRFNELTGLQEVRGEPLSDATTSAIQRWIIREYNLDLGRNPVGQVIEEVAAEAPYNPVAEWLGKLKWDKTPRIGTWLVDYCGAPNKGIIKAYGKRFLISCVARALRPGCKVDTMLIFQGGQGKRKSTAFEALVGQDWFSDSHLDFRSKDALQTILGSWVHEIPELDSLKRSEETTIKAILSSRKDKYRPAYGRHIVEHPRRVVFVGTTNDEDILSDPTGSRRFWPVQTASIDIPGITANREQLWAEALHLYIQGEQWWLTDEEEESRKQSEHLFQTLGALEEQIVGWLKRLPHGQLLAGVSFSDILDGIGDKPDIARSKLKDKLIREAMPKLGFVYRTVKGRRAWHICRPDEKGYNRLTIWHKPTL